MIPGRGAAQVQGGKGSSRLGRDRSRSRLCLGTATVPNNSRSAPRDLYQQSENFGFWFAAQQRRRRAGVAHVGNGTDEAESVLRSRHLPKLLTRGFGAVFRTPNASYQRKGEREEEFLILHGMGAWERNDGVPPPPLIRLPARSAQNNARAATRACPRGN